MLGAIKIIRIYQLGNGVPAFRGQQNTADNRSFSFDRLRLHANPGDIRILSFHRLQNDALSAGCGLHLAAWQPAINLSSTGRIEYLRRLVTASNKRWGAVCNACEPLTKKGGGAVQPRRRGLLGNDMDSDRGTDLSMHLNHDLVFSEFTNHALRQPHFGLVNFTTSGR